MPSDNFFPKNSKILEEESNEYVLLWMVMIIIWEEKGIHVPYIPGDASLAYDHYSKERYGVTLVEMKTLENR